MPCFMHANIEAVRIQYPFMQFLEIALYFPPNLKYFPRQKNCDICFTFCHLKKMLKCLKKNLEDIITYILP